MYLPAVSWEKPDFPHFLSAQLFTPFYLKQIIQLSAEVEDLCRHGYYPAARTDHDRKERRKQARKQQETKEPRNDQLRQGDK